MTICMDEPVTETKTARRKRMKAERAEGKPAKSKQQNADALKRRFLNRCISEFWFYAVAKGDDYLPATVCDCDECKARRRYGWPAPHVGSVGISFDCFCEGADHLEPGDERLARDATTKPADAIGAGLTIQRPPKPRYIPVPETRILSKKCGGCDYGLCGAGERYCIVCKPRIMRELRESGYLSA